MAQICTQADAKRLGLPGRKSLELVSAEKGSRAITLRLVEIPVAREGEKMRGPHFHSNSEECMFVLSGQGTTHAETGDFKLEAGDAILIPPGEKHVTRNSGNEPLILLCFFPTADVTAGMQEDIQPL